MTGRERLMATLRGEPVDRPAVSFYEIGGWRIDPNNTDPYNVFSDPSWLPLLQLAKEKTDHIWMAGPIRKPAPDNNYAEFFKSEVWEEGKSRFNRTTLTVAGRTMNQLTRQDKDVSTVWTLEHLLKDVDDLKAYLQLPNTVFKTEIDTSNLYELDKQVGDSGIVMVDTGDPICSAAPLFSMEDYTVMAFTEQELFHALLEKLSADRIKVTEQIAREFPGHLWRICGPEYATEPYLPPKLFKEYVNKYTGPMVDSIEKYGGFARIHCHGRIKKALPEFVEMGASGTDPVEPPPQGDVLLADVRREYGKDLVLFGNIEVADIENMPPKDFEKVVAKSLKDGMAGEGRGFVLMPSSCPYGRKITPTTMANYETMVRLAHSFG